MHLGPPQLKIHREMPINLEFETKENKIRLPWSGWPSQVLVQRCRGAWAAETACPVAVAAVRRQEAALGWRLACVPPTPALGLLPHLTLLVWEVFH